MPSSDGFPGHIPVQPGDKCSSMCDHPGINRDADHEAVVQSWKDNSVTVRGNRGEVVRADPAFRGRALPVGNANHLVEVWTLPGGMHVACLHNDETDGPYAVLLAYVDPAVRSLAMRLGLDEALAVDVWHFQQVPLLGTDADARTMMRHLAHAAADGAVPFSPIRPEDRARWQAAVDTMAALVHRTVTAAV